MRTGRALAATALLAGCARAPLAVEALRAPARGLDASDAALAIEPGSGDLLLVWVEGDSSDWHVAFARSADGGTSWSEPVTVTDRRSDVAPHGESSPRLVAGGNGRVAVAWIRSVAAPGRRWPGSEVRFAASRDGGRSWAPAVTLNDDTTAGPAGHIFHGAAWRGDSGLVVAWLDERGGAEPGDTAGGGHVGHHVAAAASEAGEEPDATIFAVESPDWGRSWGSNRPLWGTACPCCRVALAREADGSVLAAWRQHFPGSVRDIVVGSVVAAPAEPARVHPDAWVYAGCPHTGPGVALDAAGRVHVAWYRGNPGAAGVIYAVGEAGAFGAAVTVVGGGTRAIPTAHPRVAALRNGGALVVSDVGDDGRSALTVVRLDAGGAVTARVVVSGSTAADHPEVVTLPDGRAVVAWTERRDARTLLRLGRITLD